MCLWYKDAAGKFDVVETTGGSQGADIPSLVARQAFIDGSKILQVQGKPAHALFHTDKYLVGDMTINNRIDPQSEAFCLMSSAGTERLEIQNMNMSKRAECLIGTIGHSPVKPHRPPITPYARTRRTNVPFSQKQVC